MGRLGWGRLRRQCHGHPRRCLSKFEWELHDRPFRMHRHRWSVGRIQEGHGLLQMERMQYRTTPRSTSMEMGTVTETIPQEHSLMIAPVNRGPRTRMGPMDARTRTTTAGRIQTMHCRMIPANGTIRTEMGSRTCPVARMGTHAQMRLATAPKVASRDAPIRMVMGGPIPSTSSCSIPRNIRTPTGTDTVMQSLGPTGMHVQRRSGIPPRTGMVAWIRTGTVSQTSTTHSRRTRLAPLTRTMMVSRIQRMHARQ